jgi:hypothetical protein
MCDLRPENWEVLVESAEEDLENDLAIAAAS